LLAKIQTFVVIYQIQLKIAIEKTVVRDERERINTTDVNTLINSDSIVIKNLIKYYDNCLAVDNICVDVCICTDLTLFCGIYSVL
jgi:hypothetical protein